MNYLCMRILTAALAAILLLGTAHAKVVYVNDNASAGGDGTSWASAHKYLQDALADVNATDEIWVAEGTYKPDQGGGKTAGDRTSPFLLVNGVGMYGGFTGTETAREPLGDGNQTILSGEINAEKELWSIHVVMGNGLDASTVMNGFRITKGNANGIRGDYTNGGGMLLKSSSPTITNCVFTGNSAAGSNFSSNGGGGMYNSSSSPTLTNCTFSNNSISDFGSGGGMNNNSSSSPTLTNCTFSNNSAQYYGGGIFNQGSSSPTLTNCVFSGNSASSVGGGLSGGGTLTLTNCVFSGNSAKVHGGGLSGGGTLTNCVFINNSANDLGGGMDGSGTLTNCVFINNSASYGGGMNGSGTLTNCVFINNSANYHGGGMHNSHASTLTNCVFTNNSASNGGGMYNRYFSNSNLTLTNCVFTNNSAKSAGGGIYDLSERGTYKNTIFHQNTSGSGHADLYNGAVAGVPLSKVSHCLVSGGYSGTGNVDGSPLFVNLNDPDGPDDKWFTEDDGLRLKDGSPGIDAGHNASLPADTYDLDNDGNKTELSPFDLLGRTRLVGSVVDLGPYEFDPANPPPVLVKTHLVGVSATTGGTATGGGDIEESKSTTLTATPSTGYLFTGWSGDAAGTTNPLTITVVAAKTITANFAQDTSDDDGDGLSNYEEMAVHGTDKTKADTDGDGLGDKVEIDAGGDPKVSNAAYIDAVLKHYIDAGQQPGATSSSTPYTDGWYYYPSRGWMYTKRSIYPYFYDSSTDGWMYFRSGEDKPRFYHYGTKTWVTLGE